MFWTGLAIGLVIGCPLGMLVLALAMIASDGERDWRAHRPRVHGSPDARRRTAGPVRVGPALPMGGPMNDLFVGYVLASIATMVILGAWLRRWIDR